MPSSDPQQQRRKNLRLGLILGGIALAFFVGVIAKHIFLT